MNKFNKFNISKTSTNMYSMKKTTTSSSNTYSLNRSASSQHMGPSKSIHGFWPPTGGDYSLKKSFSTNSVVETSRGFKPSDMRDPGKKEFLTHLTKRIWKVGDENPSTKIVDLEKIFTPANDGEITPKKDRKMYASSSFYSSSLHPTVEDQVELARRISSSLSDISNQKSKGQSMYVNRKKRSVKWEVEGQGKAPTNGIASTEDNLLDENKPMLKLIMDPRGQIQDLSSLRRQGYNIESAALSPDVCLQIVHDLNSPKGKGAELFAKRRKKSEKWVVGENNMQKTTQMTDISSATTYVPIAQPSPQTSKLPSTSYLEGAAQRVQHVQKLDEIQNRFSQPKVKLVKSPWEAALETGSVDSAFQNMAAPSWPTKGNIVQPSVDSYEAALGTDTLPAWNPPPPISAQNGTATKQFVAPNPSYNSSSVNRMVDNFQKGLSNVDVYKPKLPQSWNANAQQSSQIRSTYSPVPRPMVQQPTSASYAPAPVQENNSYVPQANAYIPPPQSSPYIPTPQNGSISSTPQMSPYYPTGPATTGGSSSGPAPSSTASQTSTFVSTPQTSPRYMDYSNLNNYNTAARGWGQVKDYYRPVTFESNKGKLIYTDF